MHLVTIIAMLIIDASIMVSKNATCMTSLGERWKTTTTTLHTHIYTNYVFLYKLWGDSVQSLGTISAMNCGNNK